MKLGDKIKEGTVIPATKEIPTTRPAPKPVPVKEKEPVDA